MAYPQLHIFARWPEPGKAKTRLIPEFGAKGAAAIYTRLLCHTVEVARDSGLPVQLRVTGAPPERFCALLGGDLEVTDQGEGDLSQRLARVAPPAIVIGSDCPGLTTQHLWAANDALFHRGMVIGPARDGGYYLLGYNEDASFAFDDMPWSTSTVFRKTLDRFVDRGIDGAILPELTDVDVAADLEEWPDLLP